MKGKWKQKSDTYILTESEENKGLKERDGDGVTDRE